MNQEEDLRHLDKFRETVDEYITTKEMTNANVAKDTGIAESSIAYYRSGERVPTLKSLLILADYFDISLDILTGRKDY